MLNSYNLKHNFGEIIHNKNFKYILFFLFSFTLQVDIILNFSTYIFIFRSQGTIRATISKSFIFFFYFTIITKNCIFQPSKMMSFILSGIQREYIKIKKIYIYFYLSYSHLILSSFYWPLVIKLNKYLLFRSFKKKNGVKKHISSHLISLLIKANIISINIMMSF